ncbi:hypothetical protein MUK42_11625 [Musa troglodytarum]|uniref:Uncharacterized protein n=1 Tax=Musa troglodytarum TaxID=320322 RepID=A0A9E7FN48_9LILI|nr:hypothetical protein MUK42_07825 [Musa troglodytarum]URD98092.1 hypothetical protein MUK42_11625 [Musa troglodytarum]
MKTNLFPQIETIGKGEGKWENRWKEKAIEPWMGYRADHWPRSVGVAEPSSRPSTIWSSLSPSLRLGSRVRVETAIEVNIAGGD